MIFTILGMFLAFLGISLVFFKIQEYNENQTYTFNVEEGSNYFFTLYTLNASGGGRIRKITGGSYEILAGRYVSDTESTNAYTPACIIHAESTTITIDAVMGMSEIYLTPYACLYKLT